MSFVREPNAEPIPGYRLIEPLGSGGFGEVWKCEAPGGLYKAIKFVFGNLNSLDVDGARAEQEYKALNCVKEVRHPFVLSMDRIENVGGELFIVMELADKSLHDCFVECQAAGLVGIPRDDLLRYLRDAAEALDHMIQKHNLQHLDIKPRNLFLISDRVKVADFGLVKSVERQTGSLTSVTPLYAPPETFSGKVSEHSDQYSLAIVYQEMLTGQRPFDGKNPRQLLMQHTHGEPELRSLPEEERPVVARALSKDPSKRYPNCLAFIRALYTARMARKPEVNLAPVSEQGGTRSRSMSETMEDVLLEHMGEEEDKVPVPAGAAGEEEEAVSQLGITLHKPETGALRPTLIIGVGGFSRRALMELRCRFLDRFGDLSKIPLFHFLYLDTDADAIRSASRSSGEVTFTSDEVYHLPLHPIGNYRRRMLEQINEWLPHEKLYCLPRSLQTQGVRALGRLAFTDHHVRVLAKVRREIQQITHPDALYQSVNQTGLALRDSRPRIYVLASAGGGSSGLLTDLGYGLRRLMQQLRMADSEIHLLLFCGAPEDPATPHTELANIYATLTELNHFSDPSIPFTAQYGADTPRIVENKQPFDANYLLRLSQRTPEGLRDVVAHLGSYLFHELTTPLAIHLEHARRRKSDPDASPFRSFGTYAVWFPRGLLLRMSARRACLDLLTGWQATGEPTAQAEVEAVCARSLADPDLSFEKLCTRLEEASATTFDGSLGKALTVMLASLEEQTQQSVARDDLSNWVKHAIAQVHEWVGNVAGPHDSDIQKSRMSRALTPAVQKVAEEWEKRLSEIAFGLMDHPGRRVAAAETALNRFIDHCQDAVATHDDNLQQQVNRTQQSRQQLQKAISNCLTGQGGGFSFFGGRTRRLLRMFMDQLTAFTRQRLAEGLAAAGLQLHIALRGRLEERMRELTFCRQRLRSLQESLEAATASGDDTPATRFETELTPIHSPLPSTEAYWDAIRHSGTARLVLPDGQDDMDEASASFLKRLSAEQRTQLDQALQDRVLAPLGGLHHVCVTNSDLSRRLANPLLVQIAASLEELLPITDVAQVEFSAATAEKKDMEARIHAYYACAAPLVAGKDKTRERAFLLIPASDSGKAFGEEAKKAVAELKLVSVPGQADLMFCREQTCLDLDDLKPMLKNCRKSYEEATLSIPSSPHARFDVTDWLPLDP